MIFHPMIVLEVIQRTLDAFNNVQGKKYIGHTYEKCTCRKFGAFLKSSTYVLLNSKINLSK